jgi:hypothetical protein
VIRFGDYTMVEQSRLGAALSLHNTVRPETLNITNRQASPFGQDVTFSVADNRGRLHRGHATVLYPLRPAGSAMITELVFTS